MKMLTQLSIIFVSAVATGCGGGSSSVSDSATGSGIENTAEVVSGAGSSNPALLDSNEQSNLVPNELGSTSSNSSIDNSVAAGISENAQIDLETISEAEAEAEAEADTQTDLQPQITEPSPTITQVAFNIEVPEYQSDALQVRLSSGEFDSNAVWVRDELWSISAEFPTNTVQQLLVTFSDMNGALTLGSYEAEFNTGTSSSENVRVSANQFDTNRWDRDLDGISNLDELIAGTNPLPVDLTATQVDFRITVPVIQSDNLRLILYVDDREVPARWVDGELWNVSLDIPFFSEVMVDIEFFENEILIGSALVPIETTSNPMEVVILTSDDFEVFFDSDIDGYNNLEELRTGFDPLVDEDAQQTLTVIDFIPFESELRLIADTSKLFETDIPTDRPYFEHNETDEPFVFDEFWTLNNKTTRTIDLDGLGNGTYLDYFFDEDFPLDYREQTNSANRTNTGSSIIWEGSSDLHVSTTSADIVTEFKTETVKISEGTYQQTGELAFLVTIGMNLRVNYSFTGKIDAISGLCSIDSGRASYGFAGASNGVTVRGDVVLEKTEDDLYWTLRTIEESGVFIQEDRLVRTIDSRFFCAHSDL